MATTHRIGRLIVTPAVTLALLTAPAAAGAQSPVPVSPNNARWPREPASGPLPPTAVPATPPPADSPRRTLLPVGAGLLLLAGCTGAPNGVRIRVRRRIPA